MTGILKNSNIDRKRWQSQKICEIQRRSSRNRAQKTSNPFENRSKIMNEFSNAIGMFPLKEHKLSWPHEQECTNAKTKNIASNPNLSIAAIQLARSHKCKIKDDSHFENNKKNGKKEKCGFHTRPNNTSPSPHTRNENPTRKAKNSTRTHIFTVGCVLAPASLAALTRLEHSICESNSPMRKQQYTAQVRA